MAENVEKYLASKFKNKLEMSSKVRFHGQFKKLSTLIDGILDSPFLEHRSLSLEPGSLNQELILLNNALEECGTLSRKKAVVSPNKVITQWRSLERIRQRLEGIKKSLDELAAAACPMRVVERGEISRKATVPGVDVPSKVHGLEDEVMSLEGLLLSPEKPESFKAVGIVGTRGVGKTTLAQVIFDKPEIKDKFLPRIWVSVVPQPDTADEGPHVAVAKRILTCLGVTKEMIDSIYSSRALPGLLYAIHLRLAGKRYLIVLDDAWNTDSWFTMLSSCFKFEDGMAEWGNRLGYGLPKGSGGAVIVTTRSEEAGNLMIGRKNLHFLHPFSDPEICWNIFNDEVRRNGVEDINSVGQAEKLKAELTKKCDGLPLAARVMGQFFVEQLNAKLKPKESDRVSG